MLQPYQDSTAVIIMKHTIAKNVNSNINDNKTTSHRFLVDEASPPSTTPTVMKNNNSNVSKKNMVVTPPQSPTVSKKAISKWHQQDEQQQLIDQPMVIDNTKSNIEDDSGSSSSSTTSLSFIKYIDSCYLQRMIREITNIRATTKKCDHDDDDNNKKPHRNLIDFLLLAQASIHYQKEQKQQRQQQQQKVGVEATTAIGTIQNTETEQLYSHHHSPSYSNSGDDDESQLSDETLLLPLERIVIPDRTNRKRKRYDDTYYFRKEHYNESTSDRVATAMDDDAYINWSDYSSSRNDENKVQQKMKHSPQEESIMSLLSLPLLFSSTFTHNDRNYKGEADDDYDMVSKNDYDCNPVDMMEPRDSKVLEEFARLLEDDDVDYLRDDDDD